MVQPFGFLAHQYQGPVQSPDSRYAGNVEGYRALTEGILKGADNFSTLVEKERRLSFEKQAQAQDLALRVAQYNNPNDMMTRGDKIEIGPDGRPYARKLTPDEQNDLIRSRALEEQAKRDAIAPLQQGQIDSLANAFRSIGLGLGQHEQELPPDFVGPPAMVDDAEALARGFVQGVPAGVSALSNAVSAKASGQKLTTLEDLRQAGREALQGMKGEQASAQIDQKAINAQALQTQKQQFAMDLQERQYQLRTQLMDEKNKLPPDEAKKLDIKARLFGAVAGIVRGEQKSKEELNKLLPFLSKADPEAAKQLQNADSSMNVDQIQAIVDKVSESFFANEGKGGKKKLTPEEMDNLLKPK